MLVCPRELWDIPRRRRQSAVPDHVQWMSYLGTLESFHILVHFGCYINHVTFTWWVRSWLLRGLSKCAFSFHLIITFVKLGYFYRFYVVTYNEIDIIWDVSYTISPIFYAFVVPQYHVWSARTILGLVSRSRMCSKKLKLSWWNLAMYVVGDLMTRMVVSLVSSSL